MDRIVKINQAYSLTPWRKQLQLIGLFLVVLVGFGLIAGVYLNVTARAATVGRQIQNYHNRIDELEFLIADLQSQLAFLTSASEMDQRAQAMGFRRASTEETIYLMVEGYTGRSPAVLASESVTYMTGSVPVLSQAFSQSLLDWIFQGLSRKPFFLGRTAP